MNALDSAHPDQPLNKHEQVYPDLTEEGVELAHTSAEKLLGTLNPETDALFFVSSDEARAIETANVYREVARTQRFEVIKPEHTRSDLATEVADGEIRVLRGLSMDVPNVLGMNVFSPPAQLAGMSLDWSQVPSDFRERWERAHAIIKADDRGSWGANFHHHSAAVKEIFPEIKSTEDLYNTQFKNLLRLAEFAKTKAATSGMQKNLKVLAFGHESYMAQALEAHFGDFQLKNCEAIGIEPESDGTFVLTRSGVQEVVGPLKSTETV